MRDPLARSSQTGRAARSGISGERRAAGVEKDVAARSRLKRGRGWQGDVQARARTGERRSGRQQQRARQADARAHGAKIADSALRLGRQRRCGCCRMSVARTRRGHNVGLRAWPIEVDMAERKRELASQREQRQPRRGPLCPEPMHSRDFPDGGSVANLATQFKPRESRVRRRNGTGRRISSRFSGVSGRTFAAIGGTYSPRFEGGEEHAVVPIQPALRRIYGAFCAVAPVCRLLCPHPSRTACSTMSLDRGLRAVTAVVDRSLSCRSGTWTAGKMNVRSAQASTWSAPRS